MFDALLIQPILNILVIIYHAVSFVHIPYALGFSIILLTVLIRIVLYPLTSSQLKVSTKMQKLSPYLSRLKEQHKKDPKKLQEETMKLYKEHGVNPAAGCLPALVQIPIIWGLYTVLLKIVSLKESTILSEVNKLLYKESFYLQKVWDPSFFGLSLAATPTALASTFPLIVLVPVITGLLQFVQSKMMFAKQEKQNPQVKKDNKGDFASALQMQSLYFFPVMIGFFSFQLPFGLSLYWNAFTIFGILQQYQISGWGGLEGWIFPSKKAAS